MESVFVSVVGNYKVYTHLYIFFVSVWNAYSVLVTVVTVMEQDKWFRLVNTQYGDDDDYVTLLNTNFTVKVSVYLRFPTVYVWFLPQTTNLFL